MERKYTIGELSELTGVSRRAVHFYVQRGLLPPPAGAGRGHYYTHEHVERLGQIKTWQQEGCSLDEIGRRLQGPADSAPAVAAVLPAPDLWLRLPLAEGLELHLQAGRFRPSPARLRRLAELACRLLDPKAVLPDDDD